MTIKKGKFVIILIVFVAFILSGCAALQGQTGSDAKIVVCVGDSITSGVGVTDASVSSYPAQLSKKIGGSYQVLNYGVAGSTVIEGGGAYKETRQYSLALRSGASAVVIALGTNDCRAGSWDAEVFETAYRELVNEIYHAKADADIILVLPPAINITEYNYSNEILINEMIPIIQAVADERGFKTVDAYSAFEGNESLYADGLHPNEKGAALLAKLVKQAIKR